MFVGLLCVLFIFFLYEIFCARSITAEAISFSPDMSLLAKLPGSLYEVIRDALPLILMVIVVLLCVCAIIGKIRKGKHVFRILDYSLLMCIIPLGFWEMTANTYGFTAVSDWPCYRPLLTGYLIAQTALFILDMIHTVRSAVRGK